MYEESGRPETGQPVTGKQNVFQRVLGIFFSPQKTFEALDQKPDWLIPLIIAIVVTVLVTIFVMPITMPEQMDKQREKMAEQGMSQEQIDQATQLGSKIGYIAGPITAAVGTAVIMLIFAGLLFFAGNVILGGKTTFSRIFSGYNYSYLIPIIGSLVKLPLILQKKTIDIHFSLASFLSEPESKSFVFNILKSTDIFLIWQYVVLAIGFAVFYKFSLRKAGIVILILAILHIVVSAGFMTAFSPQ